MKALKETTDWWVPSHTYILDGDSLVGYIPGSQGDIQYFAKPIRRFDQRGRQFERVELTIELPTPEALPATVVQVQGSKPGVVYSVDTEAKTCSCPGFTFRGACKHVKQLENA